MGLSELTASGHNGGGGLRLQRQRLEQACRLLLSLSHATQFVVAVALRLLVDVGTALRLVEHRHQWWQPTCHNLVANCRLTDGKAAQRSC